MGKTSLLDKLILLYVNNSDEPYLTIKKIKKDLKLKSYEPIRRSLNYLCKNKKLTLIKYKGIVQIIKND